MNLSVLTFFKKTGRIGLVLVLLLNSSVLCAQLKTDESIKHKWFDDAVGQQNSSLYNGILFVDTYKVINAAHRYFATDDFQAGVLKYDGQIYYDLPLKYDLYGDEILVNPAGTSKALVIQLRKSKIEEFLIDNSRFLNTNSGTNPTFSHDLGFCEVLAEKNSAYLLKKHTKKIEDRRNAEFQYKEFISANNYFLVLNGTLFSISSQRDWISVFPDDKKDIKSFYKGYKVLRQSNTAAFHKLVFERFYKTPSHIEAK